MNATMPVAPEKKPYSPPRLVRYGDVRVLTQGNGGTRTEGAGTKKPSDRILKENLTRIGTLPSGINLYLFDYKSEFRESYGASRQMGVMADEVEAVMPAAVSTNANGHKVVDYAMLGIRPS